MTKTKGETIYYTESTWRDSSGRTGRTYDTYRRIDDVTFKRISERDTTPPFERTRDFGMYRLAIDLKTGDVYSHTGATDENDWPLRRFGDAVRNGVEYERIDGAIVDEAWLKQNALDVVRALLRDKAR